jgi:hypothetical protein
MSGSLSVGWCQVASGRMVEKLDSSGCLVFTAGEPTFFPKDQAHGKAKVVIHLVTSTVFC